MKRTRFSPILILLAAASLRAETPVPVIELIDTPSAEVVDHYAYYSSFRFYTGGGVLTKTAFGVFPRLNLGFSLDTESFIGSDDADLNRPTLNLKFRFYDGKRQLPALAVGYDGQGYFFDETSDEYLQREKGLYVVGSGEVIVPNLNFHGGLNIYDFSNDKVHGFVAMDYVHNDLLEFIFEADNLLRKARNSRLNLGARYFMSPHFSLMLAGRDLWAAGRDAERIVQLHYTGSF